MLKSIVISSISFSTSFINILPIFTINISSTLFFIDFEIEDSGQNFGLKKKNQTLKPYTSHLYPKNRGRIFLNQKWAQMGQAERMLWYLTFPSIFILDLAHGRYGESSLPAPTSGGRGDRCSRRSQQKQKKLSGKQRWGEKH